MPSEFALKVAQRIRLLRTSQHLSLRELSRRSGLAPESVSRSERGAHEISLTNLDRLCTGLGVTMCQFFDFGAPPSKARALGDATHVSRLLEIAEGPQRAKILKIVEILLEEEEGGPKRGVTPRKSRRPAP